MKTSRETNGHRQNPKKKIFTTYMQEKLAITVLVITLALFALIYVLYRIVEDNKDSYNQIVLSQQEYDSRVIPYRRGNILDRNGTVLATTEEVYNLILDPRQIMMDEEDYLEASVSALSSVFGYDATEMRSLITGNADKAYIRYQRQMSYDDKEAFEKYEEETNTANRKSNSSARVKGVWFEKEYKRIYPYDSLACNVVGFATGDGAGGAGGIEQSYNDALIGTNGREYGYLNDESNLERVIKPAENGNNVVSTIDVNIQNIVEKYIDEWQNETGSDRVGVVVMNPKNGEVLAMSSDVRFDLNNPREIGGRYTDDEIYAFGLTEAVHVYARANKEAEPITQEEVPEHYSREEIMSYGQQVAWNQIWRNYCISDTYEPGSPSKIFTVSAGLEEGLISENDSFYCDGGQQVADHFIRCVKRIGHGMLTVEEALMQSCNDAMMQIAAIERSERFGKYQEVFGFGKRTGIDLPGEADTSTLVYTAENMKPSDLATNSFGQNYNCTMIQMAAAYSSVINGGSFYKPTVVRQVVNEQGAVVKENKPELMRETVSESTSNFIKHALYRTVEEGTGKAAAVPGYEIAGKTGTAQKYPRGNGNYLVSFCGFAPAMDPEVLVYVIIDTPHVADQPHSSYASGVFQKIMADILPYLNVFPTTELETIPEEITAQLPEAEGITDNTGNQVIPETPKTYETDEYVEEGADAGIPEDLPEGETAGTIAGDDYPGSDLLDEAVRQQGGNAVRTTSAQGSAGAQNAGRETTAATTTAAATAARTSTSRTTAAATTTATKAAATAAATTAAQTTAPQPTTVQEEETQVPGQIPIVAPNPNNQ